MLDLDKPADRIWGKRNGVVTHEFFPLSREAYFARRETLPYYVTHLGEMDRYLLQHNAIDKSKQQERVLPTVKTVTTRGLRADAEKNQTWIGPGKLGVEQFITETTKGLKGDVPKLGQVRGALLYVLVPDQRSATTICAWFSVLCQIIAVPAVIAGRVTLPSAALENILDAGISIIVITTTLNDDSIFSYSWSASGERTDTFKYPAMRATQKIWSSRTKLLLITLADAERITLLQQRYQSRARYLKNPLDPKAQEAVLIEAGVAEDAITYFRDSGDKNYLVNYCQNPLRWNEEDFWECRCEEGRPCNSRLETIMAALHKMLGSGSERMYPPDTLISDTNSEWCEEIIHFLLEIHRA